MTRKTGRQIAKAKSSQKAEPLINTVVKSGKGWKAVKAKKPKKLTAEAAVKVKGKSMTTKQLVVERGKVHGDWIVQANLVGGLKNEMRWSRNWPGIGAYQREALEMIQLKVSRILTGDSEAEEHWDDIAGYAYLGKGGHPK